MYMWYKLWRTMLLRCWPTTTYCSTQAGRTAFISMIIEGERCWLYVCVWDSDGFVIIIVESLARAGSSAVYICLCVQRWSILQCADTIFYSTYIIQPCALISVCLLCVRVVQHRAHG